jgi:hypothetical protein
MVCAQERVLLVDEERVWLDDGVAGKSLGEKRAESSIAHTLGG